MDTNAGKFRAEDDPKAGSSMTRIALGEVVKVKGEEFEVAGITERYLTLKLLSAEDRQANAMREIAERRDG